MERKTRLYTAGLVLLLIGFGSGFLATGASTSVSSPQISQVRANIDTLHFVNPLLLSAGDQVKAPLYDSFASRIDTYIRTHTGTKDVVSASMYFRDLNTGQWTGVNEDDLYAPSSMLKVVTMMAALKAAERDPGLLNRKLPYAPDASTDRYLPGQNIRSGSRTVTDLIYDMIVYSDNAANAALLADADINDSFNFVYALFKLPRKMGSTADFMSAKSYSSVYRVLYNSSLFQWKLSDQALSLLSKTAFANGLVAGVPHGTAVAHKFGEAAYPGTGNTDMRELHDCGIVYYPGRPYFLCVMTKGPDPNRLQGIIADISKYAWDEVASLPRTEVK